MSETLVALVALAPLLVAPLAPSRAGRWLVPAAAVPALLASGLVAPGTFLELPGLLLGARLGVDAIGRAFLAFTGLLWLVAALSSSIGPPLERRGRFRLFFSLAMAGNLLLIVAHDVASFYCGFALMSLAAYGLVVHDGTKRARRAGRVYLSMALTGEVALFAAFVLVAQRTGTLTPTAGELAGAGAAELALLVVGLGIKAGLLGLHMWLPLAHPVAPVPASAVLSGAMIKVGLLGWLRYLPLGHDSMPILGGALVAAGAVAALGAVIVGLMQRDPKVVLAYSSIAKIGTMALGLGIAASRPSLAPAMTVALVVYAAHHGLVKGALFLGVGVVKATPGRWPVVVLALLGLVLAGAPLTSGAVAKAGIKSAGAEGVPLLGWGLSLAGIATALLMVRFVAILWNSAGSARHVQPSVALPWFALVAASLASPILLGGFVLSAADVWPLLAALVIALAVARTPQLGWVRWLGRVPPGDLLEPLTRAGASLWGAARRRSKRPRPAFPRLSSASSRWREQLAAAMRRIENNAGLEGAGPLWLALILALAALVARL